MNRTYTFFSKLIFPRSVSMTQRMQFWQSAWWSFAKVIFFGWKLEGDQSKCSCFSKKIFLKVFPGLKKCSFDNSAGKIEPNPKFCFPNFGNDRKFYEFFGKIVFPPMFLKTRLMPFGHSYPLVFCWGENFLPLEAQRDEKICIFFSKIDFPQT